MSRYVQHHLNGTENIGIRSFVSQEEIMGLSSSIPMCHVLVLEEVK